MKQNPLQPPIKIWYEAYPQSSKILWPIVEIKLSHKKLSLPQPVRALVDSGANQSILHPMIAEALGFSLKKLGPSKPDGVSVSGEYRSWLLPEMVELNIYGYPFNLTFTVIDNQNLIWPCILGEDSIFQFAKLDFSKFKGYFEVRFRSDIH